MVERVRTCPKCAGPLPEIRFARTLACPYCGAVVEIDPAHVSASTYREALAVWNAPSHDAPVATIGESHCAIPGFDRRTGGLPDHRRSISRDRRTSSMWSPTTLLAPASFIGVGWDA